MKIVPDHFQLPRHIRVFPKVDHSANVARIVLVEVVDLNFC